jgi:hypothetical protein
MCAVRGLLDEEQDVDPLAEHRVDTEQVTGKNPFRLRLQELPPARPVPAGCGIQTQHA